jgi:hypothetical protein
MRLFLFVMRSAKLMTRNGPTMTQGLKTTHKVLQLIKYVGAP